MDLYEYQARQLLEEQDIPTPDAIFAQNSHEVAEAAGIPVGKTPGQAAEIMRDILAKANID